MWTNESTTTLLRYLCISNCANLTDTALVSLGNNCKELVTLECAGLSHLTDTGFQARDRASLLGVLYASHQFLSLKEPAKGKKCP